MVTRYKRTILFSNVCFMCRMLIEFIQGFLSYEKCLKNSKNVRAKRLIKALSGHTANNLLFSLFLWSLIRQRQIAKCSI